MAIALRGSAVVPAGNPTTGFSVTIPSAVVADDVLYLHVTSRDSTGLGSLTCTDNDTGGNTWALASNSTDHKITVWWKRATSGTASKSVTIAGAVGSCSGVLKCFSGAIATGNPHTDVVLESNASGDESHAEFTPSNADSMVFAFVTNYANDNAVTTLSFATLGATTMTEKLSTGGSDCAAAFGHVLQSGGPSATGTLTWAQTNGTTYSVTMAIRPPAEVVGTLSLTLAAITITAAGDVKTPSFGTLSQTLAAVSLTANGTVTAAGVTGTLSQTLAAITLSSAVHVGADVATWAWRTGRAALRRFTGYRRRGR